MTDDEIRLATSEGCAPRGTIGWYCCRCPLRTFNAAENLVCRKCVHRRCGQVGVTVEADPVAE